MLKAIVHGAILSLLFVGCSQKLPEQNLPECKNDEDKITGCVERIYYENGQLHYEIPYKDDKRDGIMKWYYENGQLEVETPYKDDKENGVKKWYYKNGQLGVETHYKDGKKDGIEREYYENGQLESEALYKNGDFVSMKQFPLNTKQ